jgi:DNA (cytosine-5)-methyltransferase 1
VDHTKKLKNEELTHISLCTGYGGIDLGLQRAIQNVRTIAFVEIETFAVCNLVAKMENGLIEPAPIWSNLKTFPWEMFNGKVDILSGGFPCQPFSAAGRGEGDKDPRHLFPYIKEGIRKCRPSIVFLENVEGILSSKLKGQDWSDPEHTPVLLHILRELERLGYKATAGLFSASETGAPHQRKRIFILGVSNELTEPSLDYVTELIRRSKPRKTAYPARRGREQYWYEPPRVTVGNTKYDGLLDSKKRRNFDETSNRSKKGEKVSIELEGASRPYSNESLSRNELDNTDSLNGNERDRGKPRVLPKKNETKQANRSSGVDNFRQSEVCREPKPKVGGNVNGASNWLDCTNLYQSCDNRTDELRMLGNGVVPGTARTAFITMWEELGNTYNLR